MPLPLHIGFARAKDSGEIRVFRTNAKTKEELQAYFDGHGENEELIEFLSFDSNVAHLLGALWEMDQCDDLMKILRAVFKVAR